MIDINILFESESLEEGIFGDDAASKRAVMLQREKDRIALANKHTQQELERIKDKRGISPGITRLAAAHNLRRRAKKLERIRQQQSK